MSEQQVTDKPGMDLARWIWCRLVGIPITEPYDGEFRLLLIKIAAFEHEIKQRESFAAFHQSVDAQPAHQPVKELWNRLNAQKRYALLVRVYPKRPWELHHIESKLKWDKLLPSTQRDIERFGQLEGSRKP